MLRLGPKTKSTRNQIFPSDCECKTTTKKALHDWNATKCHQLPRNATKCHECHPHMFLWDYQTGNIIQFRKLINAYAYPKNNATPRAILGLSSVWSHSSLHHLLCRLNAREDTIARYTGTISTIARTTKCIKITWVTSLWSVGLRQISTNSRLRGLNVEEVGGRRESQSPTPNRAVRKGCYSIDAWLKERCKCDTWRL